MYKTNEIILQKMYDGFVSEKDLNNEVLSLKLTKTIRVDIIDDYTLENYIIAVYDNHTLLSYRELDSLWEGLKEYVKENDCAEELNKMHIYDILATSTIDGVDLQFKSAEIYVNFNQILEQSYLDISHFLSKYTMSRGYTHNEYIAICMQLVYHFLYLFSISYHENELKFMTDNKNYVDLFLLEIQTSI